MWVLIVNFRYDIAVMILNTIKLCLHIIINIITETSYQILIIKPTTPHHMYTHNLTLSKKM